MLFLLSSFPLRNLLLFWWVYLYIHLLFVFSLFTGFNILALFSVLVLLIIICLGEVIFWSSLFGVLEASCTWMVKTFSRFGNFSVIILLNMLHTHLAYTSSSSMPMILRFGLLMQSLSSCIFLSQLLSCLTKISSVFFFNFYLIFELRDSVFHLFQYARVTFHCVFC
jgi:hypothetical protein